MAVMKRDVAARLRKNFGKPRLRPKRVACSITNDERDLLHQASAVDGLVLNDWMRSTLLRAARASLRDSIQHPATFSAVNQSAAREPVRATEAALRAPAMPEATKGPASPDAGAVADSKENVMRLAKSIRLTPNERANLSDDERRLLRQARMAKFAGKAFDPAKAGDEGDSDGFDHEVGELV